MKENQNCSTDRPADAPTSIARGSWTFSLRTLILVVTGLSLLMGLFASVPDLGELYATLLVPPLAGLVVAALWRRWRGRPFTTSDKAVRFALLAILCLLVLGLLACVRLVMESGSLSDSAISICSTMIGPALLWVVIFTIARIRLHDRWKPKGAWVLLVLALLPHLTIGLTWWGGIRQQLAAAAIERSGGSTYKYFFSSEFSGPEGVWFAEGATDDDVARAFVLVDLRRLDLSGTQISDTALANVGRLPQLLGLDLYRTSIGDRGLAQLRACTRLEQLNLFETRVSDAGLTPLRGCKNLQYLNLANTQITGAGLAHLSRMPSNQLLVLNLSGSRISDAGLAHLRGVQRPLLIDLTDTTIGDEGMARLAEVRCPLWLDLTKTRITDAGLAHAKEFFSLNSLCLSDTRIGDAGLAHLGECKALHILDLERTQVTDVGVNRLRQALPDCEINR